MKSSQGSGRGSRATSILVFLVLVGFVGAAYNTYVVVRDAGYDQRYLELTGDMRLYALQLSSAAQDVPKGEPAAFDVLSRARRNFSQARREFVEGGDDLPSAAEQLGGDVARLNTEWSKVNAAAETLINNRDIVLNLFRVVGAFNATAPALQSQMQDVVAGLLESGAGPKTAAAAQRQVLLLEQMIRGVEVMLGGGDASHKAVETYVADVTEFGAVLKGLLNGDSGRGISRVSQADLRADIADIQQRFEALNGEMNAVFGVAQELHQSGEAALTISDTAPEILQIAGDLSEGIGDLGSQRVLSPATAVVFVALIIIALALLGMVSSRSAQRRLQATSDTNERNQTAILRLLDELADLADGDLTTSATVTEDFTGAIADSINYTIDQLRVLVSQINETAQEVSTAAQGSQDTALNLAEAAESQAKEIAGASAAISEMAVTIDRVSSNARESAAVAQRSVVIANNGAEVVQNTISGMDNIREQIQETSKRIKRLGESTQEIGDIISLINDIADQTNILALNAAIQASMAGDAGRGFAVVADEVQRLAERSSGATKQIETLVKAIQSDTNEAVVSMEQTTSEVVRGARLAQDAGAALTEIESVSKELAELIDNISNVAADQAKSAGQISSTMKVIQEITSQTSAGTTDTARSIGELAEMTNDLRSSVAGFTLPERAD